MEKGDLRVPVHFIARALYIFGELDGLTQLLDTARDDIGLTMMDEQLPQRIRKTKRTATTGSL
jgi:hypothetical protein